MNRYNILISKKKSVGNQMVVNGHSIGYKYGNKWLPLVAIGTSSFVKSH